MVAVAILASALVAAPAYGVTATEGADGVLRITDADDAHDNLLVLLADGTQRMRLEASTPVVVAGERCHAPPGGASSEVMCDPPTAIEVDSGAGNDSVALLVAASGLTNNGFKGPIVLHDGPGDDTFRVQNEGPTTFLDGPGDDEYVGGVGPDRFVGGPGADRFASGGAGDIMDYSGSVEPVHVSISDGPDDGAAGEHDDVAGGRFASILGGAGDDTIVVGDEPLGPTVDGGPGADRLTGGRGRRCSARPATTP